MKPVFSKIKSKFTNYQIVAFMFFFAILIGTAILSLPISVKEGQTNSFIDSFFTATSAVCVTGLVTVDTFTHWSTFGQVVIMLLVQIGGLGVMTIMTIFSLFIKRQLTLQERSLFIHSNGSDVGSAKTVVKFVAIGTLSFELFGALMLMISFIPRFGAGDGIYYAVFHSIAAFCNAGFDLTGIYGEFTSFITFRSDVVVHLTLSFLTFMGGIGFLVWADAVKHKFNFKKFSLHSKIVLIASILLVGVTALLYFVFENNYALKGYTSGEQFLACLSQAVSLRTAGFAMIDPAKMSEGGKLLSIIMMVIGGSPGSTAGGIKTTTLVVLIFSIIANVRRKKDITVGNRRIDSANVHQAYGLLSMYLALAIIGCGIICIVAPEYSLADVVFEVVSALSTVGYSVGLSVHVAVVGKVVLILLMYIGRVGMLSFAMIFAGKNKVVPLERPTEKIIIG